MHMHIKKIYPTSLMITLGLVTATVGASQEPTRIAPDVSSISPADHPATEEFFNRLQWRGKLSVGKGRDFSLYDPINGYGFWVTAETSPYGIEVTEYNREHETLQIRMGTRTRTLNLAEPGAPAPRPRVRLVPPTQEEAVAALAGGDTTHVPMVTLIRPRESEETLELPEPIGDAPAIEFSPPSPDDEMLVGAEGR
jgi:hypothetical protein